MWWLYIILGILLFVLFICYLTQRRKLRDNINEKTRLKSQKEKYEELYRLASKTIDDKTETYEKRIADLESRNIGNQSIIQGQEWRIKQLTEMVDNSHEEIKELKGIEGIGTGTIDAKNEEVQRLQELIDSKNFEFNKILTACSEISRVNLELTANNHTKQEELKDLVNQLNSISNDIIELQAQVDLLKLTHRAAICFEEGLLAKWELKTSEKERRLIVLLSELCDLYPELAVEFRNIEWRKVWLGKLQDLCKKEGLDVNGIYRLELKSDPNICYIGQAVNIKDRWYQHCKKMIGVDNRGNEKLYDYRPEDFYWSVLEKDLKVSGEGQNLGNVLDIKERYWIEFYKSNEGGLNKV